MSSIVSWLSNNGYSVDAEAAEAKVREKYPLLLHEKETIEMAFGHRMDPRDKTYFTNRRILMQDGKGIGSKRKNYKTVPYWSLDGFRVSTAGKLDADIELKVMIRGYGSETIDFAANSVDAISLMQYMNSKVSWDRVRGSEDPIDATPPPRAFDKTNGWSKLMDQMGNNATQLDPALVQVQFSEETPLLLENESVDLAFKAGRDTGILTDKRVIDVDVKGMFGKKIEFSFYTWRSFVAFGIQTAGQHFDRDSEMKLYTNRADKSDITFDFRKSAVNLYAIQKYLTNKLLGVDESAQITAEVPAHQGQTNPNTAWWFRDNQRPMDPNEMQQYYTTVAPILQTEETVEFAFKGRRDILLFTTKRVIDIDPKGWHGVKIEYTSIPWGHVVAFGVKTAGKLDQDTEARIWTKVMHDVSQEEGHENEPIPGMSFLEFDFNKHVVDIMVLKKYLSSRIFCNTPNLKLPPNVYNVSAPEAGLEKFFSKVGSDQQLIDPTELNLELHTNNPILLEGESVIMAFKAGRDLTLFTNKRVMELDTQGWTGLKVSYTSISYDQIRAFSVESAGGWDRDSELDLLTGNRWDLKKWAFDFRKGKADILTIQKFFSAIVLGSHDDAIEYLNSTESSMYVQNPAMNNSSFVAWLNKNSKEIDANTMNSMLHSDPPILLQEETIERAFQQGRDSIFYTNLRVIKVDVQGLSGKKVEYQSYPWKWVVGFEIETAGHLDPDAEVYIYFDIPGTQRFKQSILVKTSDIMQMHQYLSNRLLF